MNFLFNLTYNEKLNYLENRFDLTNRELRELIFATDLSVEEKIIRSEKGSKGYWRYIYKTCNTRHEKKLTHNCNYELAQ